MGIARERLEAIRANAALVMRELTDQSGSDFGLDKASVAWLEGFIERQRSAVTPEVADGLVDVLGSYLGEAIIAAVPGAAWADDANGSLGVLFATGDMVFPFNKVQKQLCDGLGNGESILSFYNISVSYVATGKLGKAASEEAP